ncbi:MerR family transcriptional regulator [uncultured Desulfosarcina sp.]|uniref:MerR family transcriptional regulator n=1 Tax=uncultured Desulfosarcina sp. TaxID=218289 RepID=UPI0029C82DBC|nr:MerR family transcriptional regulator [uncultured Desulfosarcina sp.]
MPEFKDKPQTRDGRPFLKMKEIVNATGVPKSTIILYVNTGLLPQPVRTQRNMAYYHPSCVERVAFIKQTQSRYRLPLAAIKGLLKEMDKGHDVDPLVELQIDLFGSRGRRIGKTAFFKTTGLTADQVNRLCEARILVPMADDRFDAEDQAMGRMLKMGFDLGMTIPDIAFYPDLADIVVKKEIALRQKYTDSLSFEKDAAMTLKLTRMARALRAYVIDRIMQKRLSHFKGLKNRTG